MLIIAFTLPHSHVLSLWASVHLWSKSSIHNTDTPSAIHLNHVAQHLRVHLYPFEYNTLSIHNPVSIRPRLVRCPPIHAAFPGATGEWDIRLPITLTWSLSTHPPFPPLHPSTSQASSPCSVLSSEYSSSWYSLNSSYSYSSSSSHAPSNPGCAIISTAIPRWTPALLLSHAH